VPAFVDIARQKTRRLERSCSTTARGKRSGTPLFN